MLYDLSVRQSVYLSVHLPASPSVRQSASLSVHLPACQSASLSVSLSLLGGVCCLVHVFVLQAAEEVSAQLATLKSMLCGSGETEPQSEVTAQLAQEIYNHNLLEQLITDLAKIDFEVSQ